MLGWVLMGASWYDAIVTAVAVLIITCPCALGLAIPTVQTVASGDAVASITGIALPVDGGWTAH